MWSMNQLRAKLIFSKCGPNKETCLESKNYGQRRKKLRDILDSSDSRIRENVKLFISCLITGE